ncbi:MAG: radical SAM protein [Nitrospinae bacterium]|nr:radical SAM protein [Nitrospinota bacterium]
MIEKIKKKYIPAFKFGIKLLEAKLKGKRFPLYVGLFITERCNLSCIYCFPNSPNRKVNDLSKEQIFEIIDELYVMGTRYITILGGEPMIRKDFGEIVDYIVNKGMVAECGTNGFYINKHIEAVKKLFTVCNSIDGDKEGHDANRGEGSWEKIIESIETCQKHGVPIQMRAVFTKKNVHCLKYLLELSKKYNTSLALAEQSCVKPEDISYVMTTEEVRDFWIKVKEYKKEGYDIDKSDALLDKIINYPVDIPYDKIFYEGDVIPEGDFPKCNLSQGYCFIDVDGMMYPCANLFGKYGKNIFEVGIQGAWDYLGENKCLFCRSSIQDLKSYFFGMDYKSFSVVLRNFLSK